MNESVVLVSSLKAGVATITLNRPEKRNAMNGEVIQLFIHALKEVATDRNIRVVIINGTGANFCAGADITWMRHIAQSSRKENIADAKQLALLLQMLYTFPKPTIALAQGSTLGGGLGLMACCDITIAADTANFCFSEAKMGLAPSVISPYIIPAIGERAARYYFLTAEKFSAQEAQRIGLVHRVVLENEMTQAGMILADQLIKNSPHALTEIKNLIATVAHEKISKEVARFTAEHLAGMRVTEDAKEGLQSFLEKRTAQWKPL